MGKGLLRSLLWITGSTALIALLVTMASVITLGLMQILSSVALAAKLKATVHSLQLVFLALLYPEPGMIACQTIPLPVCMLSCV